MENLFKLLSYKDISNSRYLLKVNITDIYVHNDIIEILSNIILTDDIPAKSIFNIYSVYNEDNYLHYKNYNLIIRIFIKVDRFDTYKYKDCILKLLDIFKNSYILRLNIKEDNLPYYDIIDGRNIVYDYKDRINSFIYTYIEKFVSSIDYEKVNKINTTCNNEKLINFLIMKNRNMNIDIIHPEQLILARDEGFDYLQYIDYHSIYNLHMYNVMDFMTWNNFSISDSYRLEYNIKVYSLYSNDTKKEINYIYKDKNINNTYNINQSLDNNHISKTIYMYYKYVIITLDKTINLIIDNEENKSLYVRSFYVDDYFHNIIQKINFDYYKIINIQDNVTKDIIIMQNYTDCYADKDKNIMLIYIENYQEIIYMLNNIPYELSKKYDNILCVCNNYENIKSILLKQLYNITEDDIPEERRDEPILYKYNNTRYIFFKPLEIYNNIESNINSVLSFLYDYDNKK